MPLSTLADIADLVAACAIIVSLVFVGYELHLTRKQSELANWRDVLQSFTDYKAATNSGDLAEFLVRAHADYHALDEAGKMRFGLYLEQGVHIGGNFLKHNDSLPRKLVGLEDAIMHTLAEMLTTPGGAAWWQEAHERRRFMPATYVVVDDLLARHRRKTAA
ncbi:hypothetical protein [Thetidibacter halocola]|uniref:DUF4760 domain-containing protein n=1 Tax=Thetidibacter halocola TaxID=2827239 RepID=A0A8J7WDA7_9RHOB|nr:hypothetical protein [Thetidibacter halocola]MBS0125480.1 hypothetical protein [Thetidibacter halocola]